MAPPSPPRSGNPAPVPTKPSASARRPNLPAATTTAHPRLLRSPNSVWEIFRKGKDLAWDYLTSRLRLGYLRIEAEEKVRLEAAHTRLQRALERKEQEVLKSKDPTWVFAGIWNYWDKIPELKDVEMFGASNTSAPSGGGLFGSAGANNNNSATGGSSLFGGGGQNNATSGQSGGGPFGGPIGGASQQPASTGGSLFGNLGATSKPATGGGLFGGGLGGGATSQPAAGGSSLFGGSGATSQPPASSAGGGGGSLFGQNTDAQPATSQPAGSGSLFGGLGTQNQNRNQDQSQGGSSLFGNLGTNNQNQNQAQNQGGSSLFGGLGANNQNQGQNPGNDSLFGNLGKKPENAQQQQSVVEAAPANPSYFDQLLERGRKRQNEEHITQFGQLPALELGLADISRKVRKLGEGGPSAGMARGDDARAHYLLSASGVNTNQALRDLEMMAEQVPASASSEAVTGVQFDLARKHHDDFQTMVDNRVKKAQDDFNKMIDEKLHGVDWAAHHQRIYEHFGLKKPQYLEDGSRSTLGQTETGSFGRTSRRSKIGASTNGKSFGMPNLSHSIIGNAGPRDARSTQFGDVAEKLAASNSAMRIAPEDRVLRIKQGKYIDCVKALNDSRIAKRVYPLLQNFADVETQPSGEDTTMLVHAYRALAQITGEDPSKTTFAAPDAVKERQYLAEYLDEGRNSTAIKTRILSGSRTFLEKLYYDQVESTINKHLRDANMGGRPTPLAKVKGYARVRAVRKELGPDIDLLQKVGDDYCWVVIFYLLRCGLLQEALAYIKDNTAAFRNIDRRFVNYLQAYVNSLDNRLPPQLQTEINNDFSQRSKMAPEDSIDPYRMLCYKIVGRCDLHRRSFDTVNADMMDWLWLQFALAREYNRIDETAEGAYALDELRTSIKEIGERYFGKGTDMPNAPTTFFFMQILAGMFEKAVADLYPHSYISAVHFAIALDYYGLLRVSDISDSEDLLITRGRPKLALGAMVGLYTRDFRTADSAAAVDYLALICLNKDLQGDLGKAQRNLCYQALIELVLETRDFASLLGDIRSNGQKIGGSIQARLDILDLEERDFLRHITLVAAREAENRSRTTDAALLFHLADEYEKVVQITNEAVSLALTTELGEQPQKLVPLKPRQQGEQGQQDSQLTLSLTTIDDPVALSRAFREVYGARPAEYNPHIPERTLGNRDVLLRLADARHCLENGDWAGACDFIKQSEILPLTAPSTGQTGNLTLTRAKASNFTTLQPVLARAIGHVMVWTVVALTNQASHLRLVDSDLAQATVKWAVATVEDVMTFAGLIRYQLPGRVWDTLARAAQEVGTY